MAGLTFAAPFEVVDGWPPADDLLHPPAHRYRYHCTRCGRFVRFATVRKVPAYRWEDDEHERTGDCSTCGPRVDVVWGQS